MKPEKKILIQLLALLGILLLMPFSSPASAEGSDNKSEEAVTMEEVKEKVAAAGRSIENYTVEQRDQAVAKTRQELDDLDRNIDKLEKKMAQQWEQLSAETREKWQATLKELRKKRVEAAEWYGSVKRGSADAWEEIKKGYDKAYSELDRAWEKAKEEFGKGDNNGDKKI